MKDEEDKLANAIIALHQEIKRLHSDIEKHQAQTNLALGEMHLSYLKLDESFNAMRSDFNKYAQRNDKRANGHETRMVRLEEKTSGGSYIVREHHVPNKKIKKKK